MPKPEEIETRPDGWERFEHAVDAAVLGGPKHRHSPRYLVIDGKLRVAGNVQRNDDGSITADVYRNLDDYKSDQAMERAVTFDSD